MPAGPSFSLKTLGASLLLLAGLLFLPIVTMGAPARAADDVIEAPSDDIELPAQIAPDDAETPAEGELIEPDELTEPDELNSAQEPAQPKVLDRSFMRPDLKDGSEGAPPPHSAEESKQDKLAPLPDDLPLPAPVDKPKLLAELYEQLGKARDAEAAAPIVEAIENLWRLSGSDTVDLLTSRAERFAKAEDLDLAQEIVDATVDMAPDDAEAWHIRAKVHYLKKEYELAIADLRRALDRDPKHYAAMNDLGVALEAIGAKKEALQAYRRALAVNPFLDDAKRAAEELGREVDGQDI
jgi:tetratricopeptide (TPR) repeat protein